MYALVPGFSLVPGMCELDIFVLDLAVFMKQKFGQRSRRGLTPVFCMIGLYIYYRIFCRDKLKQDDAMHGGLRTPKSPLQNCRQELHSITEMLQLSYINTV